MTSDELIELAKITDLEHIPVHVGVVLVLVDRDKRSLAWVANMEKADVAEQLGRVLERLRN